jgi:AraC-like DNA-binding protein
MGELQNHNTIIRPVSQTEMGGLLALCAVIRPDASRSCGGGEGPHAAFNRLRMQRVEDLLLNSNLTMEAISERVGLSSASALNRAVKDHFGRPPQQLRTLRAEMRRRR